MTLTLMSAAFGAGDEIPRRHTCQGENLSPPLAWSGAPAGTRSFALLVEDPDAPDPAAPLFTWVHWILYDLPPTLSALAEGMTTAGLPGGTREGLNDWKNTGYGGPCPPVGRHRYVHRLYALDVVLPDLGPVNRTTLLNTIKGHVLAQAELVATYRKS